MIDELTLKDLESKVKEYNLVSYVKPSGKNNKIKKKDYVKLLQKYYLYTNYSSYGAVPKNLKYRLAIESPQLCYQYTNYNKKEDRDEIWKDNNRVWLTEKIRGVRATFIYTADCGVSVYSRHLDTDTLLPLEYNQNLEIKIPLESNLDDLVVDVELALNDYNLIDHINGGNYNLIVGNKEEAISALLTVDKGLLKQIIEDYYGYYTNNFIKFYVLDVYKSHSKDLRESTYEERYNYIKQIPKLLGQYVNIDNLRTVSDNKKEFHEGIIKQGGEGTVAVYIDKPCRLTTSRKKYEWVKIKLSTISDQRQDNGLIYVDAFISDYTINQQFNLIDSLTLSMFSYAGLEEEKVDVVKLNSIPLDVRKQITVKTGKGITLNSEYELKVVEFKAKRFKKNVYHQGIYDQDLFESAHFVRFRDDKSTSECILDNYIES